MATELREADDSGQFGVMYVLERPVAIDLAVRAKDQQKRLLCVQQELTRESTRSVPDAPVAITTCLLLPSTSMIRETCNR